MTDEEILKMQDDDFKIRRAIEILISKGVTAEMYEKWLENVKRLQKTKTSFNRSVEL